MINNKQYYWLDETEVIRTQKSLHIAGGGSIQG